MKTTLYRRGRIVALSIVAPIVLASIGIGATEAVDPTLEQKREAEVLRGVISGRALEDRPGSILKGAELPDKDKFPGLRPDDELKIIHDDWMGVDFAVNLTLARKWREVLGGSALEWTGKVAPSITPGTVITSANYKSFPDLEKLLPPQWYKRLEPGVWDPLKEIHVGETDPFFPTHEYIEATKQHSYVPTGYTIKDWKGGLPFPRPTSGDQVLINYLYRYWVDDLTFRFKWHLVGGSDNLERTITGQMFGMRLNGRTLTDPKPRYGEAEAGVLEKIGTLIESPKDVRGLALSRTRHVDMTVTDSIQYYLPALRRVRRLSGRDTQDPIAGTDLTWDDYVAFYQQVSPENVEVKLVDEGEILYPSAYTKPVEGGGYMHNASEFDPKDMTVTFKKWQRRPVWIIEVISKDPSYIYSKRRMWVDKELPNVLYVEAQDRKGNHWKTQQGAMYYNPTNGDGSNWDWANFADDINKHRTTWIFEWTSLPGLTPDYFDTSLLTKKTQ
ncbi:MAG: DUF1329 domain-containing protein [Candidatus Binatia bacterium]